MDLWEPLVIQVTVIFLKEEETRSLRLIVCSSIGGLLLLAVIVAILFKVSSALYVCRKEKALGSAPGFSTSENS